MNAAALVPPGADGVARTAADRSIDLRTFARALICVWWGKHLTQRTLDDRRAMRKTATRAAVAVLRDHGRLPEPAREALALSRINSRAGFSMAGPHAAQQQASQGQALVSQGSKALT